jgi:hypothetical protein
MLFAQGLSADLQCLPVQRFRFLMPPGGFKEVSEVIEPGGVVWMLFAKGLSADLQ